MLSRYEFAKKGPHQVEIAKFDFGKAPRVIYTCTRNRKTGEFTQCDCPAKAAKGECKHLKMAKIWSQFGEPQYLKIDKEKKDVVIDPRYYEFHKELEKQGLSESYTD